MAKYKLQGSDESNGVFDTENGMSIPNAPGNRHWFEYEQWKLGLDEDGNALSGNPGVQAADSQFTLDELKDNKRAELKAACAADIESGFTSNAMGMDYDYESSVKDQLNIVGAAQAGTTLDFTVIDGVGNKLRVSHSAAQMQQVFTDGVTEKQNKKNNLYSFLSSVNSAANEAAVAAITYS